MTNDQKVYVVVSPSQAAGRYSLTLLSGSFQVSVYGTMAELSDLLDEGKREVERQVALEAEMATEDWSA